MKILMLGWELPPHNSGGLGIACYQLCKALADKGVDIEFVLPYTADHSDIDFMKINAAHPQDVKEVQKVGIAYDSFKYIMDNGDEQWVDLFGQSSLYEEAVERIAVAKEFDVIHAHDWLTCRAGIRAREISGKPLIVHIHSVESDRAGGNPGNPFVRDIEYTSMLLADRIIAVSQLTKNKIIKEYGIPADKIEVVHNSFDADSLISASGENAYSYLSAMKNKGYSVVASVGRITIQKGLPNLLQAFQKVVSKEPKALLLIVGSGEQYFELIRLSAELGISKNVVFTDFQRGKNYRDAYAVADLFVMPSISEPFGLTPYEAAAYGTPSVVSKQSGIAEVLTNCLKVDFWDTERMADQILAVLQHKPLKDELTKNVADEFNRISWRPSAKKVHDLYTQHATKAVL